MISTSSMILKSNRSGQHDLAEKLRQIRRTLGKTETRENFQYLDLKCDRRYPTNIMTVLPAWNVEPIMFYQPQVALDSGKENRLVYIIKNKEASRTPEEANPFDIFVKSKKPKKQIKLNKRKKKTSVFSQIEDLLDRHITEEPYLGPKQSEESISENVLWTKPKKDIGSLSEETLQKIFFHFSLKDRCQILSKVCSRWWYILKDPVFWTELQFEGDKVETTAILTLIKSSPWLVSLRLIGVSNVASILQQLCRYANSIKELVVKYSRLDDNESISALLNVLSHCQSIETLNLKGTQLQSERFYLELGLLKNLRCLNLGSNKHLTPQDLMTMSINCRELEELKLENIFNTKLKDESASFIISNLQDSISILEMDMQQLGTAAFQAILKCHNLTCLCLTNCLSLNGKTFRKFDKLKNLKKLKITRANDITSGDFQHVFSRNKMRRISELDINGCWRVGHVGLQAITSELQSLTSLSLKNCKTIKGSDLVCLSRCKNLESLNLAHTGLDSNQLTMLVTYAKNLRSLIIDCGMCNDILVKAFRNVTPKMKICVSISEYFKDERPLNVIDV